MCLLSKEVHGKIDRIFHVAIDLFLNGAGLSG